MSAVYGFGGGFPSVLLHRLCFLGVRGCGGVRKAPAPESCPTHEEMITRLPCRIREEMITRIKRKTPAMCQGFLANKQKMKKNCLYAGLLSNGFSEMVTRSTPLLLSCPGRLWASRGM